jgi:hypothetical protein
MNPIAFRYLFRNTTGNKICGSTCNTRIWLYLYRLLRVRNLPIVVVWTTGVCWLQQLLLLLCCCSCFCCRNATLDLTDMVLQLFFFSRKHEPQILEIDCVEKNSQFYIRDLNFSSCPDADIITYQYSCDKKL